MRLLGSLALVGRDGDGVGAGSLAEGHVLGRCRSRSARHVLEALNRADLGCLEAGKLVGPGCVDRSNHALTRCKGLEHVGRQTAALVVDVDALEGDCIASCSRS